MNIGIVTTWFERGAAYVSRQYRSALQDGHRVFIYARGGESYSAGDPEWDDATVTWGRRLDVPVPTFIELEEFRGWVERNRLDLVFFNEQHWWEPVLLCNRMGVKTCAYVDYYTRETVPLFGCYDLLICNTRRHLSVFDWHPQAFFVPWGTDIQLFSFAGEAPVAPGQVTFFHSAGVSPQRKGTDLLLRAFDQLQGAARLVLHAQLDLAASFPELRPLLERLVLEGRLTLLEKTITAPGAYHLGDIYVYPSRLDGIGLTVAEALACGLPVIATDCAPMNELVREQNGRLVAVERSYPREDGYYWPCSDASVLDLAEQMQFYLDLGSELPRLKAAARSFAEEHLDWRKNSAGVAGLLAKAAVIPQKEAAQELAREYEARRLTAEMRLYRLFPRHFKRVNDFYQLAKSCFKRSPI